jgi:para-aminobenzoate synthetase component 1
MNSAPRQPDFAAVRCREVGYRVDGPLVTLSALPAGKGRWLLDSAHPHARLGRYAFAGADPCARVECYRDHVDVLCERAPFASPLLEPGRRRVNAGPFEVLRALSPVLPVAQIDWPAALPESLPFVGGVIGGLGYHLGEFSEALGLGIPNSEGLPDMRLMLVDHLVAWDHVEGRAWEIALGFGPERDTAVNAAEEQLAIGSRRPEDVPEDSAEDRGEGSTAESDSTAGDRRTLLEMPVPDGVSASLDRAAYLGRVKILREEIAEGNVYEVNLTRRLSRRFDGDPWALYLALRKRNPAPFACYLEFEDIAVLGSSPERFLRVDSAGEVESRPIKGTRPRGTTPAADADLEKALATSEKDRAENLMIVDLVRNDLGRVCEVGSVRVSELMRVEAYASVFQLVSAVVGRLAPEHDRIDLIRAAFPPGSMTGAPKRAAMQLIEQLEPTPRGLYSGAIGYFDVRGGMDLSVVIRTMMVSGDQVQLNVGGAIVSDSDPAGEYDETIDKARALLAALSDVEALND